MEPNSPLHATLRRLDELTREQRLNQSDALAPDALSAATGLPERSICLLLQGHAPSHDTVEERVCSRLKAVADAYMARTGKRMSELAAEVSQRLGISEVWARQICVGKKVPNVGHLHHLARFFGVEGGEPFFTAPADEALNRALQPILARLETRAGERAAQRGELALAGTDVDDVRGMALRQARDLSPERWRVLSATLEALLDLDNEEDR
ncbi:hypothetical protein ABT052_37090 [Streptomyces sp. NPDC002766]|uniref:hypothetical protein n=1 Tax=unclassified Streptomyces TaxID=2593676 RepID=UPI003316AFAA